MTPECADICPASARPRGARELGVRRTFGAFSWASCGGGAGVRTEESGLWRARPARAVWPGGCRGFSTLHCSLQGAPDAGVGGRRPPRTPGGRSTLWVPVRAPRGLQRFSCSAGHPCGHGRCCDPARCHSASAGGLTPGPAAAFSVSLSSRSKGGRGLSDDLRQSPSVHSGTSSREACPRRLCLRCVSQMSVALQSPLENQ